MNTIATDNQFSLSTPNNEGRLEVPADTPLGQIFANTDTAVKVIELHGDTTPIETIVETVQDSPAHVESGSGTNLDDARSSILEALDSQFTVGA